MSQKLKAGTNWSNFSGGVNKTIKCKTNNWKFNFPISTLFGLLNFRAKTGLNFHSKKLLLASLISLPKWKIFSSNTLILLCKSTHYKSRAQDSKHQSWRHEELLLKVQGLLFFFGFPMVLWKRLRCATQMCAPLPTSTTLAARPSPARRRHRPARCST